ncbi:transglutaminase TgpA family protein [Actinoplanes sp. CA-131856]
MTGPRRLGLVAAAATLLAAAPISSIFDTWKWLMMCLLVVGFIAGAAFAARSLRFPTWAQALSMIVVLLLMLTWMFPSGHEFLVPTPSTFGHFADLFTQAGQDTRSYAVPVPDRDGLLFVTVLGIGSVAIAVDLLTVVVRRPALAGLPMLAIYSVPVAVYIDSVPVLPFIIGAIGFLWLLVSDNIDRVRRFGRRFTGDGRDVDVWEPSPLAAAGRRLGVIGVAAAVLLPLAVPTITGGLLSQLTQSGAGAGNGVGGGGNGGRINLFASLSGNLTQSETVELVRLTTNETTPFYLRFGVADQLTNLGFGSRSPSGQAVAAGMPDPRTGTAGGSYQEFTADVKVSNKLNQGMLPVYQNTVSVDGLQRGWFYDNNQQVVYSNRNSTKELEYKFDYVRARYQPTDLRQAEPLAPDDPIVRLNTAHPEDATVAALVTRLTAGKTNEYDKVRALYDYFSSKNGFTYSLSTQAANNSTEIAAFLQNKVGYCQQYAAALAWMARQAGIPSRVAFGFTRGDSREGNTYVITNKNAHAWTEVYLQGFGWIPFDATPSAGVRGAARSDWAPDTELPPSAAPTASTSVAPGAEASGPAGTIDRPDRPDLNDPGVAGSTTTTESGNLGQTVLIVALIALVLALLLVPALRRVLVRRHRYAATVPRVTALPEAQTGRPDVVVTAETTKARQDAHAAWDELLDTMVDYRVPLDPSETPRVTAQRLIKDAVLIDESATSATLLGTAEERARYARKPLQGGELTAALNHVRRGLSRSATRRTRLTATLLPPSVLMRWRLGLADSSAKLVGAGSRFREVLSRFSPRRLLANRGR